MLLVFDSKSRSKGGVGALASVFRKGFDSGNGWNQDAAALLAIEKRIERQGSKPAIVVHVSDDAWCGSLTKGVSAQEVVEYVAARLVENGRPYINIKVPMDCRS